MSRKPDDFEELGKVIGKVAKDKGVDFARRYMGIDLGRILGNTPTYGGKPFGTPGQPPQQGPGQQAGAGTPPPREADGRAQKRPGGGRVPSYGSPAPGPVPGAAPYGKPAGQERGGRKGGPAASVSGILMIVFGFIGAVLVGMFFVFMLFYLVLAEASGRMAALTAIFAAFTAAFVLMIVKGFSNCARVRRLKRYQRVVGESVMCPIAMLSSAIGRPEKFVVKDLQKMIALGMLPDGHIDEQETCLMLDFDTYQQYLRAQAEQKRKQEEAQKAAKAAPKPQTGDSELDAVVADGGRYLRLIKEANDAIPGEEISQKISRLEAVTARIFECVSHHPDKLPEIRRFLNYYLPTTLKLLNSYKKFDAQPVQGENILVAKKEINDTLTTINTAFENLLDSLFQDEVLDISSDISALEAMLAQEGLTGGGFKDKPGA